MEAQQSQPTQGDTRLGNQNDRGEEMYQDEVAKSQQKTDQQQEQQTLVDKHSQPNPQQ